MNDFYKVNSILPFAKDQFIDVENLWRFNAKSVEQIANYRIGSRIVTFLRSQTGKIQSLLGIIKWLGEINHVECVGIDLDEPCIYSKSSKLDNQNKFEAKKGHGIYTPITNIKTVTNYTAMPIPNEMKSDGDINIRSAVKIYRINSGKKIEKLYGIVLWFGCNDAKECFYGIKLDNPIPEATDGTFFYQKLFDCKNNLGLLVPVGMVKKNVKKCDPELKNLNRSFADNEKYQSIISMLLKSRGDVNIINENSETVFDIANKISDQSVLQSVISTCSQAVNLSMTKSMEMILANFVESENWHFLSKIIFQAKVDEKSNKYLLRLCISVLKKNNLEMFDEIMEKCIDKNDTLSNGETFLTTMIKSDLPVSIMMNVLQKELFDVNQSNLYNETPLIVACEFLLTDIVKLLIKFNCDIRLFDNKAIEISVLAKSKATQEHNNLKVDHGSQIIEMLSEASSAKESFLCSICMDMNKNVALNCGHLICSSCEEKLDFCPFCKTQIESRLKIFL